jgi:hypothetical protein
MTPNAHQRRPSSAPESPTPFAEIVAGLDESISCESSGFALRRATCRWPRHPPGDDVRRLGGVDVHEAREVPAKLIEAADELDRLEGIESS